MYSHQVFKNILEIFWSQYFENYTIAKNFLISYSD